jgi:hypothetical protein
MILLLRSLFKRRKNSMSEIIKMPGISEGAGQADPEAVIKQIQVQIISIAARLVNLIPEGASILCHIPVRQNIITPGQEPQFQDLLITRPIMLDEISGKLKV